MRRRDAGSHTLKVLLDDMDYEGTPILYEYDFVFYVEYSSATQKQINEARIAISSSSITTTTASGSAARNSNGNAANTPAA